MSAPNKRDSKAFSGVKVPSSAPIFKGFASSTRLLQLLLYSMGSINLGEVMLLLPWECGSPMNAVSVSSCGYVWRWAKIPHSQEIHVAPIQDLRQGSDWDALLFQGEGPKIPMAGSSQPWQGDRVVGSSLPNPYVGVRIAVFPRNGNVPGSWRWSALTVRSHFVLQMSVWGSRSDFSLIFHLEFLPTPKFSSQSRHRFT